MRKRLSIFLLSSLLFGCLEDSAKLQNQAKEFTKSMGYDFKGASCMNTDNDNDGYVSCAVNIGTQEPLQIECASLYSIVRSGCRLVKINMLRKF